MVLVFIEIIQLNFCGLSTMTKKNIEERAKLDSILSNENDDEDSNNNIKDIDEKVINLGEYTFELNEVNTLNLFIYLFRLFIIYRCRKLSDKNFRWKYAQSIFR